MRVAARGSSTAKDGKKTMKKCAKLKFGLLSATVFSTTTLAAPAFAQEEPGLRRGLSGQAFKPGPGLLRARHVARLRELLRTCS